MCTPAGCATTVVTGLVGSLVLFTAAQAIDTPAAKDKIRSAARPDGDQDVRFTLANVSEKGPLELATPTGVRLTPQQVRFLRDWSYTNSEPGGYTIANFHKDLEASGAASVDQQYIDIKLEGRRVQPVFIDNIQPVDIKRTPPYGGALVDFRPQDGGETLKMIFDFDEPRPIARGISGQKEIDDAKPGGPYFRNGTITVKDGAEDSIVIKSLTAKWAATYRIRIDYRIGGKRKHWTLDNHGRPFAVTARNCTKPTLITKPNTFRNGRISYQDIWDLGNNGMERPSSPGNHPVTSPDCLKL